MGKKAALLVVDVQVDFCPGGALPVPEGDQVVPILNRYLSLFRDNKIRIFASRDWHPRDSAHFKEQGGIWPPHCVQESEGARFHPALQLPDETVVISKGTARWDDGYSAMEGAAADGTPLVALLQREQVEHLYVGGLATDYCVKQTILDAIKLGFTVTLLIDAVRGVNLHLKDSESSVKEMVASGSKTATLNDLQSQFPS